MKIFKTLRYFILIASAAFNSGCYEELSSEGSSAYRPAYLAPEDFAGITSVSNLTTGLSIVWLPANSTKNVIGYRIYRYEVNEPKLIATVASNVTSYIDGNVVSGNNYSYLVRAVDAGNAEDTNSVKKTGIFWEGLTSVTSTDQSKIRVTFSTQLKGYSLKIYLTGEGRAEDRNIVTITSDASFSLGYYDITRWSDGSSLKPGASYKVGAEIFEANNQTLSDGNRAQFDVNTLSYGFNLISAQKQGWNNVATVRAFGESPLSNLLSVAAANTYNLTSALNFVAPQRAQVEIGFIPFSLPAGLSADSYRYKVIRAPEGEVFNSSTLTAVCPSTFTENVVSPVVSSLEPCIVSQSIHAVNDLENGLVVVHDQGVWDSVPSSNNIDSTRKPPRYRYFMTLQHLNNSADISQGTFTEEIPQASFTTFSVLVPVPPANMALVNRESANYEFCKVQQSKPTDPLKNNRCEHFEVGNNTFNSGPGNSFLDLSGNYYDFGYNLFVDRYPLACNNNLVSVDGTATTNLAVATNHPVGTLLDLTGQAVATPAANDVLYSLLFNSGGSSLANGGMSNCRLYYNGAWTQIRDFPTTFTSTTTPSIASAFQMTLTSEPRAVGSPKFNYPNWTQSSAQEACNSFSSSGYGLKRVPRMREFRAFTAPPFEISVDGKNLKDFYAQAINAAVPKDQTNWTEGSCLRTTGSGLTLNTRVISELSATYPTALDMFTGTNISRLSVTAAGNLISFMLGSQGDALCMSKYGLNGVVETAANYSGGTNIPNPIENNLYSARYPTSDLFSWNPAATTAVSGTLTGIISNLDQGNNDLSLNIVGVSTGYFIGMPTTAGVTHLTTSTFTGNIRFDQALGLPAISSDSLNLANYTPSITASKNYSMTPLLVPPRGYTSITPLAPQVSSRYTTSFDNVLNRVRCVISAD